MPSHHEPPLEHGVPRSAGRYAGISFAHTSSVHGFPSSTGVHPGPPELLELLPPPELLELLSPPELPELPELPESPEPPESHPVGMTNRPRRKAMLVN